MTHRLEDGRTLGLVHDYLTQRGGAERVVLSLSRSFPGAPIHTTLYDPEGTYPDFRALDVRASVLNRVGTFRRDHRVALPLLPLASASVRPTEDVVIASTSGFAHGFHAKGAVIAYCHAPARWLYQPEAYLGGPPWRGGRGIALGALAPALRWWDARAARRPARYLCNSRVVRDRIRDAYGIDARVVPAPHSMDAGAPRTPVDALADWAGSGYHLVVSRLLPYKNVDVLVEAVRGTGHRLVVVGDGPLRDSLVGGAPCNVRFVRDLDDAELRWVYANADTLLAVSLEDYGLTPLEAAAFGVPSLSLRAGGYLDTVVEGVTGLHVDAAQPALVRAGLDEMGRHHFDAGALRAHAAEFSEAGFAQRLRAEVADLDGGG